MQSKLQAIAAALWQIAEKTGKAGKHLDSELAVACYVKGTSRQLRIGRRNTYPAAREADICRAAFGVPDTAGNQDLCRTQRLARLGIYLGAKHP